RAVEGQLVDIGPVSVDVPGAIDLELVDAFLALFILAVGKIVTGKIQGLVVIGNGHVPFIIFGVDIALEQFGLLEFASAFGGHIDVQGRLPVPFIFAAGFVPCGDKIEFVLMDISPEVLYIGVELHFLQAVVLGQVHQFGQVVRIGAKGLGTGVTGVVLGKFFHIGIGSVIVSLRF